MIVAFLDLLGFSALLGENEETALDNMDSFNRAVIHKFLDDKAHPLSEYTGSLADFAEKSSITGFTNAISFSDSLVLGGTDLNLFIKQLANFVATEYIVSTTPFIDEFNSINDVTAKNNVTVMNGTIRYHKAFPLLFRGGISQGDDARFFEEAYINESKLKHNSLNVSGLTYLKAVKLESTGKGPRLFCDKSVVNNLSDNTKKVLKTVDEDNGIFEVIWSIEGCEATICDSDDKFENVKNSINNKLLPAAINLYLYYKEKNILDCQYKALLNLICTGIVKYAHDSCDKTSEAITLINIKLKEAKIEEIDRAIIYGFI